MGNSLLDFVLALVRDPAVAARYAADPAGALADAHLTGVTMADVNNLIPVVTDSFAAATPAFGGGAEAANVWASGAAAAAFDAFDIHVPGVAPDSAGVGVDTPHQPVVAAPSIDMTVDHAETGFPGDLPVDVLPPAETPLDQPFDAGTPDWADGGWQHVHSDPQAEHHAGDGFDLF